MDEAKLDLQYPLYKFPVNSLDTNFSQPDLRLNYSSLVLICSLWSAFNWNRSKEKVTQLSSYMRVTLTDTETIILGLV